MGSQHIWERRRNKSNKRRCTEQVEDDRAQVKEKQMRLVSSGVWLGESGVRGGCDGVKTRHELGTLEDEWVLEQQRARFGRHHL